MDRGNQPRGGCDCKICRSEVSIVGTRPLVLQRHTKKSKSSYDGQLFCHGHSTSQFFTIHAIHPSLECLVRYISKLHLSANSLKLAEYSHGSWWTCCHCSRWYRCIIVHDALINLTQRHFPKSKQTHQCVRN